MDRRTFLTTATALAIAPGVTLAGAGTDATPNDVVRALADGKTVFVDFYTDWCSTCAAQNRAIDTLRSENPDYDRAITFLAVDWDKYANSNLAKTLNIPRRSTLVVLKQNREYGRIVAGTSKGEIQKLLDTALRAATS